MKKRIFIILFTIVASSVIFAKHNDISKTSKECRIHESIEKYNLTSDCTLDPSRDFISMRKVSAAEEVESAPKYSGERKSENTDGIEYHYIFDNSNTQWADVYAYFWNNVKGFDKSEELGKWPGTKMEPTGDNLYEITFTSDKELGTPYIIFNNGQGVQTDDLPALNGATYNKDGLYRYDLQDGDNFKYKGLHYTVIDSQTMTFRISYTELDRNYMLGDINLPSIVMVGDKEYTLVEIGSKAFYNCSLVNSITIPETVTEIGEGAFYGCSNLTTADILGDLTAIQMYTFWGCENLTSIKIPDTVTSIDMLAFYECKSLNAVTIPRAVKSLGSQAFCGCSGLTSVVLPESLTNIGEKAFERCNVKELCYMSKAPHFQRSQISAIPNSATLYVPKGSKTTYESTEGWNEFEKIYEVECPDNQVFTSLIGLSDSNISIAFNQEYQLEAAIYPLATSDKRITWTSSDSAIATVSDSGLVKGVSCGAAIITASCGDVSASCEVQVCPLAKEIKLNVTAVQLYSTDTFQLEATLSPENPYVSTLTWTSSNEDVATVSESGLVTANMEGIATINVTDGNVSTFCVVVVSPIKVSLDQSNIVIRAYDTAQLIASVVPDKYAGEIVWSSSDEEIAKVSGQGKIVGITPGTATITATCRNSSATCNIEVLPPLVKEIILDGKAVTIYSTESYQLAATVAPDIAADKTLTWTSSDDEIATVSDSGLVTAHGKGTATITARNGDVTASCVIVVLPKRVTIDSKNIVIEIGNTKKLSATVYPDDADDKSIVWMSSNPEIAEVSEIGEVTALAEGVAVITAAYGGGTASCVTNVQKEEDYSSITLSITLSEGMTLKLSALIDTSTEQDVIWTSSNSKVADVSADGLVTARAQGTAFVTATCGEKSVTCIFEVNHDSGLYDAMGTEDCEIAVFNLKGIKMDVTTRDDLKHLAPGYYIINNKVELVK